MNTEDIACVQTVYLSKAIAVIYGENKDEYVLIAQNEYGDGKTELTLVSLLK